MDEDQVARGPPAGGDRDRLVADQYDVGRAGRAEQERHAAEHLRAEGPLQGGRRRERRRQRGAVGVEGPVQVEGGKVVGCGSGHSGIIPLARYGNHSGRRSVAPL